MGSNRCWLSTWLAVSLGSAGLSGAQTVVPLVVTGDPAGDPPYGHFSWIQPGYIDQNGAVVFYAQVKLTGTEIVHHGLWRAHFDGTLERLVETGDDAPTRAGTGEFVLFSDFPATTPSGAVYFRAYASTLPSGFVGGIWRWEGGTTTLVVQDGDAAGIPDKTISGLSRNSLISDPGPNQHSKVLVNSSETLLFYGTYQPGSAPGNGGVWLFSEDTLEPVIWGGMAAPDYPEPNPPAVSAIYYDISTLDEVIVQGTGRVCVYPGQAWPEGLLWRGEPGGLDLIAAYYDGCSGMEVGGGRLGSFPTIDGDISTYLEVFPFEDELDRFANADFVATTAIFEKDTPVVGEDGSLVLGRYWPQGDATSARGSQKLVFQASWLDCGGPCEPEEFGDEQEGIWISTSSSTLRMVASTGRAFDGVSSPSDLSPSFGSFSINDRDQLVLTADFDDGSSNLLYSTWCADCRRRGVIGSPVFGDILELPSADARIVTVQIGCGSGDRHFTRDDPENGYRVINDCGYVPVRMEMIDVDTEQSLHGLVRYRVPPSPDLTRDCVVDFGDYLEFLNKFEAMDCDADINSDGVFDFVDLLDFLTLFDAADACP